MRKDITMVLLDLSVNNSMDCSARLFKGGHHLKNKIKTWFFLIFAKKSNSPPQKDEFKWRKQTKKNV